MADLAIIQNVQDREQVEVADVVDRGTTTFADGEVIGMTLVFTYS